MFLESLRMSFSNIIANKMRTFLTILGIIIGVMAIIALVTVMESATGEVTAQFEGLGTGKLMVQAQGTPLKRGLSEKDLEDILAIDGVTGFSPTFSSTGKVVFEKEETEDVKFNGYSDVYFRRENDSIAKGRPIVASDIENNLNVCVIDDELAQNAFPGKEPLSQFITIQGVRFEVVGVLKEVEIDDVMSMTQTGEQNGEIIMPYTAFMKLYKQDRITSLEVYLDEVSNSAVITDNLQTVLDNAFNNKDDSNTIFNMESLVEVMDTMLGLMTNLLVGIASISLLVGGIGIMNMMLVSVTERTNEIGLRKALGAKPSSIQIQFLLESIMLSLFGGIIGMILGLGVSYFIAHLMDIAFVLSKEAIALGLGFSFVVGIIFGWAPARKASNLNPIDALRRM